MPNSLKLSIQIIINNLNIYIYKYIKVVLNMYKLFKRGTFVADKIKAMEIR